MEGDSMQALEPLEKQLEKVFKDVPALPKGAKDALVKYWPYLALALGALQIIAAVTLWNLANLANSYIGQLSIAYGGRPVGYTGIELAVIYGGVALLAINAFILFAAYSPLSKKAKKGWDLLFLASIINVVYAVIQLFLSGRGIGDFILSLAGTAIGLYLLFQIRSYYGTKKATKSNNKPEALK